MSEICQTCNTPSLEDVRSLPKIDLHAHLGGSITQKKLIELLAKRGNGETFTPFDCREDIKNSLTKCFDYFDKVNKVVTDLESLKESAVHVFDSFAAQNCLYLELRTSPKQFQVKSGRTEKAEYVETLREAIEIFGSYAQDRFGYVMDIKLLLSVDRGKVTSKEDALAQIDAILSLRRQFNDLIVGVDVCGNPSKASVVPFVIPALLERRHAFADLPITFHTAEVKDDEETALIINSIRELNIRRLGHVCFMADADLKRLLAGGLHEDKGPIGIELCPTSNMVTKELSTLKGHHFPLWWRQSDKIMLSINTDDTGLFSCDLTSEVHDLASTFQLSMEDLIEIQRQAMQSSFHPDKPKLFKAFEAAVTKMRNESAKQAGIELKVDLATDGSGELGEPAAKKAKQ